MAESFSSRLSDAIGATGPLCVGIDPSSALLADWGLDDNADGLASFGEICVDSLAGTIGIVKIQVAFFERHGSAGIATLEEVFDLARRRGLLVIADAKRGDIDNTSAAYADAWLSDGSSLAADAVTVSPFLGIGALSPMIELARKCGRAVFVVARSSNPEGRELQEARTVDGRSVADSLLGAIAELNRAELAGQSGDRQLGSVGAVVGATQSPSDFDLKDLAGPLLVPGVGAQGATAADVAALVSGCPPRSVLPSASRSVLKAGPDPEALRAAALRIREDLAKSL